MYLTANGDNLLHLKYGNGCSSSLGNYRIVMVSSSHSDRKARKAIGNEVIFLVVLNDDVAVRLQSIISSFLPFLSQVGCQTRNDQRSQQ